VKKFRPGMVVPRAVHYVEQRTGSGLISAALRYVFPDHWSFMLGEIALYSFVVLVATGTYLALYFDPSYADTVYRGSYEPLQGMHMSQAYRSTVDISLDVKAGLLIRQTHHWAALIMLASIVVHVIRVFFTGAFRKPRDLTYTIGATLLVITLLEGYVGYSLPDDLLSGAGLSIGYAVALAIPIVGANLAFLIWDGQFPGTQAFESRLYIAHVFIIPALIGVLIAIHLALIMIPKHTQFRGRGRTEQNVIGTPTWPAYALRSLGLMFAVAAVLLLLGGLVQINPIWQYGAFEPYLGTNGVQPDWYMGWLIGALRIMPPWELVVFGYTILPNPFFGGILLPGILFTLLFLWPSIERRFTADDALHHLLDRPRDVPWRTGFGVAVLTFLGVITVAGAADRIDVAFGIPYDRQILFYRAAVIILPLAGFFLAKWNCQRLLASEAHPLRGWTGTAVRRNPGGGFEQIAGTKPDTEAPPRK
jgi:ubiquinol-cytochrome c reductase cytochrome b subunit